MAQVNKSTMIGELLQIDQNIAPILLNIGMHCLGCPSSQMETLLQKRYRQIAGTFSFCPKAF